MPLAHVHACTRARTRACQKDFVAGSIYATGMRMRMLCVCANMLDHGTQHQHTCRALPRSARAQHRTHPPSAHSSACFAPPGQVLDAAKFTPSEGGEIPMLESVLADCKAARPPPLLPSHFREQLSSCWFANKEAEMPLAARMYERAFEERFIGCDALVYDHLGWGDEEVITLCELLESDAAASLKQLWLSHNDVTDRALRALTKTFAGGAAPEMTTLNMFGNFEASEVVKTELRGAREDLQVFFTLKISQGGRDPGAEAGSKNWQAVG